MAVFIEKTFDSKDSEGQKMYKENIQKTEKNKKIINVRNVGFSYEDNKKILDNFSLQIEEGSFVALLGHNGSGKSSLSKLLNATLIPDEGVIYIDGVDTKNEETLFDVRKSCGLVFQNPDNQIIASIVEDDVAFAPENLGVEPSEIRMRVDEALENVGMYEYKNSSPYHLSGGQKQRVAIAGIVAMRPKIIVLDEPTAMLDPVGRSEVIKTVTRLNREFGITVVLITHNMDEAISAKRIIVMEKGKILLDGTPREVFSEYDKLKQTGLDVPQITQLSYKLFKEGIFDDGCVLSIDEFLKKIVELTEKG